MSYTSNTKAEFYRDTGIESAPTDVEIVLLAQMPREDIVWYCEMLTTMGNLLITAGVKLKLAARPPASFSQETL